MSYIGSQPEAGERFRTGFDSWDAMMEWYKQWKAEVGPDLLGGYATLNYPERENPDDNIK